MERLKRLKQYLEEALLDPVANALYIEDLKISIKQQELLIPHLNKVFAIENEIEVFHKIIKNNENEIAS